MTSVSGDFLIRKFIGSQSAIQLAEVSCGWAVDILGKKTAQVSGLSIHFDAFECYFKGVDQVLSLPKVLTGAENIRGAYLLLNSTVYRTTSLASAIFECISDISLSLKWAGLVGVQACVPCLKGFALVKHVTKCFVHLISLNQNIYSMYLVWSYPEDYKNLNSNEVQSKIKVDELLNKHFLRSVAHSSG